MTSEQELREALPNGLPIDIEGELIESLVGTESNLPIDTGLEVTLTQVPGDTFDTTHPHVPDEDTIVLHLTPEDAREFDDQFGEFIAGLLVGALGDLDLDLTDMHL